MNQNNQITLPRITGDQAQIIPKDTSLPVEERSRRFTGLLGLIRLAIVGAVVIATIQVGGIVVALCEAFLALIIYLVKEC